MSDKLLYSIEVKTGSWTGIGLSSGKFRKLEDEFSIAWTYNSNAL
jgi:hypothetical protein